MSTVAERPKTRLEEIPLNQIRPNKVVLRNVDTESDKFAELVDSVRNNGIFNPISVRKTRDEETGKIVFTIIDGLHRFTAALHAGLETIPAQITIMSDADVLSAQIIANVQKIETKHAEYAKQLIAILNNNPLMTLADLASKLSKSQSWVSKILGLVTLPDNIQTMINNKQIGLTNSYALVDLNKVAPEEVDNFLDRAMTMAPSEFISTISDRIKHIKDDRKKGKDSTRKDEYSPVAFLRNVSEIKNEFATPTVVGDVLTAMHAETPEAGFAAAIAWVLRMDPKSQEEGKVKWEEQRRLQQEEREKRKAEREKQKQQTAAREAAEATVGV